MRAFTVDQIQRLDRAAIEEYGVPSLILMENAGRAAACQALKMFKGRQGHVSIFCGVGNNAGDGFVAARHLINAGVKVKIFLIGRPGAIKNDAAVNYQILRRAGEYVEAAGGITPALRRHMARTGLVIDAIFGVGLNRELEPPFSSVIGFLNASGKKTLSVDIPSGLDGSTGHLYGPAVKADVTVTFTRAKKGLFLRHGPAHAGRVIVADIGIPRQLVMKLSSHGRD